MHIVSIHMCEKSIPNPCIYIQMQTCMQFVDCINIPVNRGLIQVTKNLFCIPEKYNYNGLSRIAICM